MGASHRAVQIAFTALASLTVFTVSFFFPTQLQQFANLLFGSYIPDEKFRVYILGGAIIGFSFLAALISIHGIQNATRNELKG